MHEEPTRRNNDALREILDNLDELEFGIITQRGYKKLEKKIDDHADEVSTRFTRWFTKGLVAFAIMSVICAISLAGFGVLLVKQGDLTREIQSQRFKASLDSCLETNTRNKNVIARIDAAVDATPESQRKKAKMGAKPFKLIIEAVVPYTEDCVKFAQERVQGEQ